MSRPSYRIHVSRAAQVTATRPSYANGLRAAIATVLPIVIGAHFGWHNAVWMGLAGFNVSLADKGGALRSRLSAMAAASFAGLLAAIAGSVAGNHVWSAVTLMLLWSLAAGLARSWGPAATTVGIISLATFIIFVGAPTPAFADAWERGGAVAAGSAFSIVLALVLGPMRPYRPARRAVGRAYRLLARAVATPQDAALLAETREAIDAARMTLAALRRGMQGESPRGERLLELTESGDRLLGSPAAADGMATETTTATAVAQTLERIAEGVERERRIALDLSLPSSHPLHDALAAAVATAEELEEGRPRSKGDLRARYLAPLLANLSGRSAILRHAFRVAAAGSLAVALTSSLRINRGYWMTLTVILILQPYRSLTFQKGLQRLVGTIAGGIVAASLMSLVHAPQAMLLLIFAGAAVTVALLPVNYALYSFFLTPTFILLAELNVPDRHLVALRITNTLAGALLAYAAAWLFWPASERGLVREELATALHALAEYTRCVECDDANTNDARRTFLVALQNANESLGRTLTSPPAAEQEALMALVHYTKRYALALASLQGDTGARFRLAPLARQAAGVLGTIASAIAEHRPVQVETLQVEALRIEALQSGEPAAARLLDPLIGIERAAVRVCAGD